MKENLKKQFIKMFKILIVAMVIGILGGVTFVISDVSAASSSPIKVEYGGKTRHNMKIEVGQTTSQWLSFDLTGKGTISSAKWESSNKSIMTIASTSGKKGASKCRFKGIKEGHAVLKLTVKTTKSKKEYTYTEYVGISVCTGIAGNKYCFSYALPETYVYRGATTEKYETEPGIGAENRNYAFYRILYQCGGYYYVQKECEPVWSNGKIVRYVTDDKLKKYDDGSISGFVKKAHISTSCSSIVNKIKVKTLFDNYPLNYGENICIITEPYDVDVTCKWSSSNTNVVTVSGNGTIKTVGAGEATITASFGKYTSKCKVNVCGLVSYDAKSRKNIVNGSSEAIQNELKKHPSYSSLLPTDDEPYDVAFDISGDYCSLCNTSNRLFESRDIFDTNCYGFAINRWRFCMNGNNGYRGASVTPGSISNTSDEDMMIYSTDIAELVKNDVEALGGDAIILDGNDNRPDYPTDENHYLIAIRTRGIVYRLQNDDDYHFMVRKNGKWYFKDGKSGDILKIRDGFDPDDILWNARYMDQGDGYTFYSGRCYTGHTQYMVISKLPTSLEE